MSQTNQNGDFFSELGRELRELPRHLGAEISRGLVSWRNAMRQLRAPVLDYVVIPLAGPLPERDGPPRNFIQRQLPLPPPSMTVARLNRRLRRIRDAANVKGVVFILNGLQIGGLAGLQNLRRAMARLQAADKEVVVYTKFLDLRHYYLASAADRIIVPPSSRFDVVGIQSEVVFLKDALAKVGLQADAVQISPFKSMPDRFVRTDMSPELRAMLSWLIEDNFAMINAGIAAGRSLSPERVRELIDEAPFSVAKAQSAGLIDDIGYQDELDTILARPATRLEPAAVAQVAAAGGPANAAAPSANPQPPIAEPGATKVKLYSWADALPLMFERPRRRSRKYIGVINATGAIIDGASRNPPIDIPIPLVGGAQVGDLTIVQLLRRAEQDPRMAGLILHVDSPGGSALASDLMWREIRRVAEKIPVLAYMGSTAASGGYYISAACDHIMAQEGTITGSIGVLNLKFSNKDLLAKVDANRESIARGRHAGIFRANDLWSDSERALMRQGIEEIYRRFKEIVCQKRPIAYEELDEIALGRVWTGRQARTHGLVDSFGDFEDAVDQMIYMADLPDDPNYVVPVVDLFPKATEPLLPKPYEVPEEMLRLFTGEWRERLSRPQYLLPLSLRFW